MAEGGAEGGADGGEGLARLRARIEALDAELLCVLGERLRLVERLGDEKAGLGLPVEDAEREARLAALHERVAREHGVPPGLARALFAPVLAESKRRQRLAGGSGDPDGGAPPPSA